jgi:predicted transcriptional regulator of viral defense system
VEQHGYITDQDARRLGVPAADFDKLVATGWLTSICAGLYRLDGMPSSRRRSLAEAVLRVGPDAFLSHDAVLSLHELIEREPDRVRVATPHPRPSGGLPAQVEVLRRHVPAADLTSYQGIRSTTVVRALLDCRGLLGTDELIAAAEAAVRGGLLLRRERSAVIDALEPSGV